MSVKNYLILALIVACTLSSCQGVVIGLMEGIMMRDKLKRDSGVMVIEIDTASYQEPDYTLNRPNTVYDKKIMEGGYLISYISYRGIPGYEIGGKDVAQIEHEFFISPVMIDEKTIDYATSVSPVKSFNALWKFEDNNTLVADTGVFREMTIIDTTEEGIYANVLLNYNNELSWFNFSLNKISDEEAHLLLDKKINTWRITPSRNESDAEIQSRLKSLMRYSANYIRAYSHAQISTLNTERFILPFKYYNGGVELSEIYNNGNFDKVFYNNDDAYKAYLLLKNAYNKSLNEFPGRENYLIEYADFIDIVNRKI